MSDEGCETGDLRACLAAEVATGQHRHDALAAIQQKRQRGGQLVAGAQHVGRADIAGADLAKIAQPHHPRQDQAAGDGAEEIAQQQAQQGCRQTKVENRHQALR
jgi:hypothetical protein